MQPAGYTGGMRRSPVILLLLVLAGCGIADPYLYRSSEFNRERAGFGVEPEDITRVSICYSGVATSEETVRLMAEERCAAYGKAAEYRTERWGTCPLATPALAVYDCVATDG